ncbi:MAG TPA: PAS domain S-box protein [Holophagaceae bacterium]
MPPPPAEDSARIEPPLDDAALRRAILDGAAHAIISTDPQGLIRTFNPAAERLLGYRAEEVVGHATPEVFHDPEEVARRAQALSRELGRPVPPGFEAFVAKARLGLADQQEWTYLRGDGTRVPVSLSVSAIRSAGGALAGFMGIAENLTRTRADRAETDRLLRDLGHLKVALDAAAMISVTDAEGRILEANSLFCALSGYGPAELLGQSHRIVNSGHHPPAFFKELWDTVLAGRVWRGEIRNRAKGGRLYWVDATIAPLLDRQGWPTTFLSLQFDITARKEAEAALRASEESLTRAQAIAHLGNWDWEIGTGRITWSDEIFRIFGHEPRAFTPTYGGFMEAVHPEDRDRITAAVDRALGGGASYGVEHRILRPDGVERVVVERGEVYRDAEGRPLRMVGTVQDVTERRAVDRLKREFVATVSHELRTPMTAIKGSLGLLAGGVGGELPPKARELVATAQKNAERLLHLINDLLDLEKVESGRMAFELHPRPILPVLLRALGDLRDYALAFGVACDLAPVAPPLEGARASVDEGRLLQVLANLLSNAIKFSPGGAQVQVGLLRNGPRLRVEVANAGPEIPTDFRERIFDKFAQADGSDSRQRGGTGLGLSIAKALVERMGGLIGFESEPGRTVFYFELPEVAP